MAKFSEWKQRGLDHRDFQHSDRPEDWEETPHKPKSIKGCKRNKGLPHDYKKVIKWYSWSKNAWYVIECSKCGKHNWRSTVL